MLTVRPTAALSIDATYFCYDAKLRTFSAEASGLPAGTRYTVIAVRNPKTGGVREFYYAKTERDPEGEIVAWLFANDADNLLLRIHND